MRAAELSERLRLARVLREASNHFEQRSLFGLAGMCRHSARHLEAADDELNRLRPRPDLYDNEQSHVPVSWTGNEAGL